MIWCLVDQILRIAFFPGGHNQYVGRALKVDGSFCRDTYSISLMHSDTNVIYYCIYSLLSLLLQKPLLTFDIN